jgi:nitroreductase
MDVLDAIRSRRSIRKYTDKPVSREDLTKILDAGRLAPSAGNLQNWKFISVTNQGLKRKIADASLQQYWMESAAVLIVLVAEPDKTKRFYGIRGERLYAVQNIAAACQNMLLTAHGLGLGACWIGAFDEDRVSSAVGIPEEYRPQAIISIGYPDEQPQPPSKYPIEIMSYWNKWRARIEDVDAYLGFHSTKIAEGIDKVKEIVDKGAKKISIRGKELVDKYGKKVEK